MIGPSLSTMRLSLLSSVDWPASTVVVVVAGDEYGESGSVAAVAVQSPVGSSGSLARPTRFLGLTIFG